MKFNKLNVPESWQHYWSRYPEGYTILEALLSWVKQVDDMVDSHNQTQLTVENYGNRLDSFIDQFDTELQTTVQETLTQWQTSGFLDVVISEALQWQLDDYITTNEQDKLSLIAQLQQNEEKMSSVTINAKYPPKGLSPLKGDGLGDDTANLKAMVDYLSQSDQRTKIIDFPAGIYVFYQTLTLPKNIVLRGIGQRRTQLLYKGVGTAIRVLSDSTEKAKLQDLLLSCGSNILENQVVGLLVKKEGVQWGASVSAHNVEIRGFSTNIVLDNSFLSDFVDCKILGRLDNGVRISKGVGIISSTGSFTNMTRFTGCYFQDHKITVQNSGGQDNVFQSCALENTDLMIHTETPTGYGQQMSFYDCWFENIPSPAIVNAGINEATLKPLIPIVRKIGFDHVRFINCVSSFADTPVLDTTVNADFTDNFTYNQGFSRKYEPQENWTDATLQNGWTNQSAYKGASFFKDKNNIVHIRGFIGGGLTVTGTVLFTLPKGYRVLGKPELYGVVTRDTVEGLRLGAIQINADGTVTTSQNISNQWLSLSGITFRAEQ